MAVGATALGNQEAVPCEGVGLGAGATALGNREAVPLKVLALKQKGQHLVVVVLELWL